MLLSEFVNILYKYSEGGQKKADYFAFLFDTLMKISVESDNPFYDLQADTLDRYYNEKNIAKSKAHKARGMADIHKFAKHINSLSDSNQLAIEDEFKGLITDFNKDDNLGYACADLFLQILDEICDGTSTSCRFDKSQIADITKDVPFAMIAPGVAAGLSNIKNGQIFVNGKQAFYIDDLLQSEQSQQSSFSDYLKNTLEKYQTIKTLPYSDAPKPFYDFYVCNTLAYKVSKGRNSYVTETIRNVTADILSDCTNFVIITGTDGLGKSMMRHLLLDCIEQYSIIEKLPIFIPLKDFDDSYDDLTEYVYEKFDALGGGIDLEEFEDVLADGRYLLLFDGLDEIHSSVRKLFEKKLDIFSDKYSDNIFVVSSRPAMSFVAFNRFTVFELKPFDKSQALSLIDKLEFRTDEPTIKAAFRKKLDDDLYRTHREFAENPLLLTIMLMTFEQFAEVPFKMHIFLPGSLSHAFAKA